MLDKNPNKINPRLLWAELAGKIKNFYPYFLAFYLLSLVVSIFSKTWQSFFYWPAFHGALIVFTILFLLVFKLDKSYFRLAVKLNLGLKEKSLTWGAYILKIFGRLIKFISRLLLKFWRLALVAPWRLKLKVLIIFIVLVFSLFKGIGVLDFIILFYALASLLFVLNSRVAAGAALISLASCPILLILKNDALAENVAIYAYYFLVITVLTQILELARDKKTGNTPVDNF